MKFLSFCFSISLFIFLNFPFLATAQISPNAFGYYQEALRYSQNQLTGTARFQGVGGANTALGGDISSAWSNPAGLGFCRKNEISFTPAFSVGVANADFLNENTLDVKINPNLAQMGVVFVNDNGTTQNLRNGAFAITFTRVEDFQQRFTYSGINSDNSLIDYFLERNDQITPWDDLNDEGINGITTLDGLAYWTYLINPTAEGDEGGNSYTSFVTVSPTRQEETVSQTGAMNQWNISYGGNYRDKLFFGFALGIRSFNYRQEKKYSEIVTGNGSELNNFTLNETYVQNGTGFNVSAGLIYKPIPYLNLAVNIISPTLLRISDSYSADLTVNYNNYPFYDEFQQNTTVLDNESEETSLIESEYSLLTPTRIQAGLVVFLGKRGFWSTDVEFLNYSSAFLFDSKPTFSFSGDNETIKNLYGTAINFRTGLELRFDHLRLRGGMAYFDDPISQKVDNINREKWYFTGGLGVRNAQKYMDFTLIFRNSQQVYQPYSLTDGTAPIANIKQTQVLSALSFGFYF